MADEKLTGLTATSDIADDSLIYTVLDPLTVPLSRKITFANVVANFPDATELVEGKVELATTDEASAVTDTTRAVTPAGLGAAIAANAGGVLLESKTFATTDSVLFSTSDWPAYTHLLIRGYDLFSSCDATYLGVNFNGDTGVNYYYFNAFGRYDSTFTGYGGSTTPEARMGASDGVRAISTQPSDFEIKIFNYSGTTYYKKYHGTWVTTALHGGTVSGAWGSANAITSIRFWPGANTLSGTIAIYGFN